MSYYNADVDHGISAEDKAILDVLENLPSNGHEEWISARIEEHENQIRALSTARNTFAPINRKLPPEVLMKIFTHLDIGTDSQSEGWVSILHVCRMWRSLIFRTPSFWTNVLRSRMDLTDATQGPAAVLRLELFLQLSGSLPLTLSFRGMPRSASDALSPHVHRITALDLQLPVRGDEYKFFIQLLNSGMARLERLSMAHENALLFNNDYLERVLVEDASCLPRLHWLSVPCRPHLLGGLAGQLRFLEFSRCHCLSCSANLPTFQSLLHSLKDCSSLENLILEHVFIPVPSPPATRQGSAIALPALRKLHVSAGIVPVAALLTQVTLPETCTVIIDDPEARNFRDSLPVDVRGFRQVALADGIRFEFTPFVHATLETYTGDVLLLKTSVSHRQRRGNHRPDLVLFSTDILEMFAPFHAVTKLVLRTTLGAYPEDREKAALSVLLDALPLRHLDITEQHSANSVLFLLDRTLPNGGSSCPTLEDLTFRWEFSPWKGDPRSFRLFMPKPTLLSLPRGPEALSMFCDSLSKVVQRRTNVPLLRTLCVSVECPGHNEEFAASAEAHWVEPIIKAREQLRTELGSCVGSITVEYDRVVMYDI